MARRPVAPTRVGQSTVKGRVAYKDDGQPLKGVRVRIFAGNSIAGDGTAMQRSPAREEMVAFTNNRGEFLVENLAAGKYYVAVEGPGIGSPSGFGMRIPVPMSAIPRREDFDEIIPRHDSQFSVDGTNTVEVEVNPVRGGMIAGRVLKANRAPANGIAVSLVSRDGSASGAFMAHFTTQTDKNGDYRLENLPPGNYVVAAATQDKRGNYDLLARVRGESQVFTYYPGAMNLRDATAVRVDSARETSGVNITLVERNAFSVSGNVVRQQDGTPLAGVTVLLRNKDSELTGPLAPGLAQRTTQTDADGRWAFSNVMEGSYIATALVEGSTPSRSLRRPGEPPDLDSGDRARAFRESRQRFLVAQQEVNVAAGDLNGLSLAITGPGTLRGTVTKEDGTPLAGDLVMFLELVREGGLPGRPMPIRVKADGSFLVDYIQGGDVYLAVALPPDSPYSIKSLTASGGDPRQSPLRIIESAETGPLQVVLSSGVGKLAGKVVSATGGEGLSDHMLLLAPADASKQRFRTAYLTARTAADGSFSITGDPGEYFVLARKRDQFPAIVTEEFVRTEGSRAQRVVLVSGEQKQLTLRIP